MTIAEFLNARIDEDEQAALGVPPDVPWTVERTRVWFGNTEQWSAYADGHSSRAVAHVARWNPARVLAECGAKRRIIEDVARHDPTDTRLTARLLDPTFDLGADTEHDRTLRALAAVYADHPDYDPAWE